jgi:hypothetical protein
VILKYVLVHETTLHQMPQDWEAPPATAPKDRKSITLRQAFSRSLKTTPQVAGESCLTGICRFGMFPPQKTVYVAIHPMAEECIFSKNLFPHRLYDFARRL